MPGASPACGLALLARRLARRDPVRRDAQRPPRALLGRERQLAGRPTRVAASDRSHRALVHRCDGNRGRERTALLSGGGADGLSGCADRGACTPLRRRARPRLRRVGCGLWLRVPQGRLRPVRPDPLGVVLRRARGRIARDPLGRTIALGGSRTRGRQRGSSRNHRRIGRLHLPA